MKRDLKLNMGQLAETQQNILDYKTKLENLRAACEMFQKVLQNQTSVGYQTLSEELQDGIIRNIQEMETRMDALHTLLSGYITDMKGYVAPQSENEMMRVDRNDIWYNLRQIHGAVDIVSYGFGTPFRSDPDYKYAYIGDDSVDEDYIQSEISAESSRRQNNFKKLDAFRTYCMGAGYRPLGDAVDALWKIYNDNIKTFENTDDDYAWQAALYYDRWSTEWNRMQDLGKGLYDIGRGFVDGFIGTMDGLLSLALYLLVDWVAPGILLQPTPLELPESITKRVEGMEEGLSLMFKDPGAAFEAMGQSMMDTYDEEGIGYLTGNALFEIAFDIAVDKGISKVRGLLRAENAGSTLSHVSQALDGQLDEVAGFADEIADTGQTIEKVEGVITDLGDNIHGTGTGVADDIIENSTDTARATQRSIVESVENSAEGSQGLTRIQKGNYGEMRTDIHYEDLGYERMSLDRVTGLNDSTHHGIDGVYYKPDGHPPYIIAETKYGTSRLGNTLDGRQMSDTWISNRLADAVGETRANEIMRQMVEGNVQSQLVHVSTEGKITVRVLDSEGYVIKGL